MDKNTDTNHAKNESDRLIEAGEKLYNEEKYNEALPLFLEAASDDSLSALQWCGCTYRNMENYKKAEEFLLKAFDLHKDWFAAKNLAWIYRNEKSGLYDEKKAYKYTEKAAQLDNKHSMRWMGYYCENGITVEKNYEMAVNWYKKSLTGDNKEDVFSLEHIGKIYYKGCNSVEKDYNEAVFYLEKAAEAGSKDAMLLVGKCYYYGGNGIKIDDEKAFYWLKKSMIAGNKEAEKLIKKLESEQV